MLDQLLSSLNQSQNVVLKSGWLPKCIFLCYTLLKGIGPVCFDCFKCSQDLNGWSLLCLPYTLNTLSERAGMGSQNIKHTKHFREQ